jgi:hypothetical protein
MSKWIITLIEFIFSEFLSLWLYSPILGLGRLHETFHFISVTRSRTVSRAPWMGDQLVTRPLRVCPRWLLGWRIWWNERFWQGKPKYSEKTCLDTTLSTWQTRTWTWATTVGSQQLTASAMARPFSQYTLYVKLRCRSPSKYILFIAYVDCYWTTDMIKPYNASIRGMYTVRRYFYKSHI